MIKSDNMHLKGVVKTGGDHGSGKFSNYGNVGEESQHQRQNIGDYHYITSSLYLSWTFMHGDFNFHECVM